MDALFFLWDWADADFGLGSLQTIHRVFTLFGGPRHAVLRFFMGVGREQEEGIRQSTPRYRKKGIDSTGKRGLLALTFTTTDSAIQSWLEGNHQPADPRNIPSKRCFS